MDDEDSDPFVCAVCGYPWGGWLRCPQCRCAYINRRSQMRSQQMRLFYDDA